MTETFSGKSSASLDMEGKKNEVMGLSFQKDILLASGQIYPLREKPMQTLTKLKLLAKLRALAYPFTFTLSSSAPGSVMLHPGPEDIGEPCGVQYYLKIFAGQSECDTSRKKSLISLKIRKAQFAPSKQGKQPWTVIRREFILSPGELELETSLDKQLATLSDLERYFLFAAHVLCAYLQFYS